MSHVERRGKNSFRLVVTIGYNEKGTPIRERKTVKAKNQTEAKKMLTMFESEILTGKYIKTENITLQRLYKEWLENVTEDDLAPRTKQEYINILNKRILPLYGHMKLEHIKPIHVLNFVNSLKKDGARLDGKKGPLSSSSINNCYKAFNSILSFAKTMKWISDNPAEDIAIPTVRHEETEIYSVKELLTFVEHLQTLPFRWQVIVALALSSSARQGEIAALEEKHVDFDRGGIHINQALTVKKEIGVTLKETKNKRKRFVSLPEELMVLLKKIIHIRKQEDFKAGEYREWPGHLFLFTNEFGKPIRPDSISQWWGRFMDSGEFKELGLKRIRFHDLRHTSLTYLSSKGLRSKAVQNRAGHSRITTTFDIYGHGIDDDDQLAAAYIGEMFKKEAK
ncbi:site-specific integrase [Virgibacillus sediminis]|uniref:Tyrosine recombinase XerC n=1 Tax=Virgibacillus sediminis TaxID=202260 RepID=A0ABV7A6D8_9BACI